MPNPLDDALRGQTPSSESSTVITEYCQNCHIHRAFDPAQHSARVNMLYDRLPYTVTAECRVCHVADRDSWGVRHRKTLWPVDVAQNRYIGMERRFLKKYPDILQEKSSTSPRQSR